MFKVLNCFKIVPDLDKMLEDDWSSRDENGLIDTSYLKSMINCYDESALELTCRFSDRSVSVGIPCEMSAVTAGGKMGDTTLKTLAALGYKGTDRIEYDDSHLFEPEHTAGMLAEYIAANGPFDLIVTGIESSDGNNGKTPYILAEKLEMPCITQVLDFEPVEDGKSCRVTYKIDGGQCTEVLSLPLVLAVGDAPSTYLRVPTLKQRMASSGQPIGRYTAAKLDRKPADESAVMVSLDIINKRRAGIVIEGEDAADKAIKLYRDYLKGVID